jgi:hypothetical protein
MLASINPLGERGRNQRYAVTVAAYVAASTAAGAAFGALVGVLGTPVAASTIAVLGVGVLALLGLAVDARVFGSRVPGPRRQVDENWLATYRGWVYGAGFGAQLGVAFATIVTASATWIAFACAFVSGSALGGAIVGGVFGIVRALPILSTRSIRDARDLRVRMARLARWRPRAAALTTAAQAIAACALVVSAR